MQEGEHIKPECAFTREPDSFAAKGLDIPALPAVAVRVMHLISDDHSSADELISVISLDQSLTSRLLRISNSPYFRRGEPVSGIQEATTLLGLNMVQSLVVISLLKDIHSQSDPFSVELWEHSLGTGVASMIVCQETEVLKPNELLVYALLHDIGKTILHVNMGAFYETVISHAKTERISCVEAESEILGYSHCEVGGYAANYWNLPDEVSSVIIRHHEDPLHIGDGLLQKLVAVVRVANALYMEDFPGRAYSDIRTTESALAVLGLTDKKKLQALKKTMAVKFPLFKDFLVE